MCCSETTPSSTPRVGARVDFSSKSNHAISNLLFLNPSSPASSLATHVRFSSTTATRSPSPGSTYVEDENDSVMVSIHKTGDLTKPIQEAGLLQQFTLPLRFSSRAVGNELGTELKLERSLSLNVSDEGIIGRRVTLCSQKSGMTLGDGIVGFNF